MATNQRPILVIGANGKTGRRVADRLVAGGFDWEDRSTWQAALSGASAAYIAYQPDLAVSGAVDTLRAFFEQALAHGVKRLVLLSGRGEEEAQEAERALQATSADWTILRCSWFAQNFGEAFFVDLLRAGELALPASPAPEPFIDVEDIADVAAAALTEPGHVHQLYELTGPRALSFAQATAEIAHASGRDIRFESVAPEPFRATLEAAQLPPVMVDLMLYLLTTVLDGRNAQVTDGVQRALGRPARDFSDYVRRTAAAGVWGALEP
jgi:uncharacterized protein YbjT (DUF2867 family)